MPFMWSLKLMINSKYHFYSKNIKTYVEFNFNNWNAYLCLAFIIKFKKEFQIINFKYAIKWKYNFTKNQFESRCVTHKFPNTSFSTQSFIYSLFQSKNLKKTIWSQRVVSTSKITTKN
ncbi:hypothetical protein BpHYR1_046471 [Brachionus plicatilis]|uniref:Uncharacterized protein n=1 Tax=Brachionus plicatilis TaxID=10195 RepID=A0A3M7PN49_BRAPC|nr:hypothetical protein BpHYR1_046471 [Brachionus plicatilis]